MTVTIDVPSELEQRLEHASRQCGIGKDEFLRSLLEEKPNGETATPLFAFPAKIIATSDCSGGFENWKLEIWN